MNKILLPELSNGRLIRVNKPSIPLKNSIVLIGPDGSGKSTLSQTIRDQRPNLEHYERYLNLPKDQDIALQKFKELKANAPIINGQHEYCPETTLHYMVHVIVTDMTKELNTDPKFVEGLLAPKVYACITKYLHQAMKEKKNESVQLYSQLQEIARHVLGQMSNIHENVFFLDVPQNELTRRIELRNRQHGQAEYDFFDKQIMGKDTDIYFEALGDAFDLLNAKQVYANVPKEKMLQVAEEIIERSGL
ncbi:MAG: hypothetical protein FWE16_04750 [Firmicutes bacterium]|nr:hypothetical protein [Bacillota bacterium]